MAVTITNLLMDVTDALKDTVVAQANEQAECAASAVRGIYETKLNCKGGAEELQTEEEVCCRTEELTDVYETGDMVVRTTCSDGTVEDLVTYIDGQQCNIKVKSANPKSSSVLLDENCQPVLGDVTKTCKPRMAGEPYDEYFIPLCSDYGNQIYCVPGQTYAFAWTGVMNNNIKEFLEENTDAIDLNDPANPYVAVVGGEAYACGIEKRTYQGKDLYCFDCTIAPIDEPVFYGHVTPDPFSLVDNPSLPLSTTVQFVNDVPYRCVEGEDSGLVDGAGNPVYCFPRVYADELGIDAYGYTTSDPNNISIDTRAVDADGNFIECVLDVSNSCYLHPLQVSQSNRLDGCYSPILSICPAWSGEADTGSGEDEDLSKIEPPCPDICGKTASESYYTLWLDWWKCEKKNKYIRNKLLGVQGAAALYGLVESIQTYNKILDKQLDVLCNVQEDHDLLKLCSQSLLGTDDEPGILKECQANLLKDHNDRIGTINNRGAFACKLADDEIDCYEKTWRPIQKEHAPHIAGKLHTLIDNGQISSEQTTSWANGLQECVTENMLPELKRQFAPLLSSVNCTSNNLNEWRDDLREKAARLERHFQNTYECNEKTMIPAIMDMTTCMVQRVCEMRDWLVDCAKCDMDVYKKGYQAHEVQLAGSAMQAATTVIPKLVESVNWLDRNIPAALDIFNTCYAEGFRDLNPKLFKNAQDLAPEIQACHKWFKDNAKEHKQFFEDCYRDRECQLVKTQLDFAIKLVSSANESLCRLDNWSQQDRGMYDTHFRNLEEQKTGALVSNGHDASNQLQDFRQWFDDRTKEFHDTYHDNWLPCDIENLKYHCDVWDKVNPLEQIHRNADDVRQMVTNNSDMYQNGVIRANTYLDKVFQEADKFDYCVEDAAAHHVRKRYDQALQEIEQCTSRYAKGALAHSTLTLKAEAARDEGAAYARAGRWAWWANNQLDNLSHQRRLEMLQYVDAVGGRYLDATNSATAAMDGLLNQMSNSIQRGQSYLANMQDAGRSSISIMGNEVDAMLRMVQLWHFWPELAQQGNTQFNAAVSQVHNQAADLVQMGHYWPDLYNREKLQGQQVAENAIQTGVQLSQIGQYYLSQADSMNSQRSAQAIGAGQLGNQFTQSGHNLHKLANDKMTNALAQSVGAASQGVSAGQLGAQHNATAQDTLNKMTLNALEHLKAGISAMAIGVDFLQETRQTQQLAGSYGINATNSLLNLFKHGQNNALLALNASEQCKETEFDMLCKAKDYVMQNYEVTQRSLQGYASGNINAAQAALQSQGQNAGSAFALLGNSVEGFLTSNNSPPFPTGGPAFGTGQFGLNGGAFT